MPKGAENKTLKISDSWVVCSTQNTCTNPFKTQETSWKKGSKNDMKEVYEMLDYGQGIVWWFE